MVYCYFFFIPTNGTREEDSLIWPDASGDFAQEKQHLRGEHLISGNLCVGHCAAVTEGLIVATIVCKPQSSLRKLTMYSPIAEYQHVY